jgi:hypothetical protein
MYFNRPVQTKLALAAKEQVPKYQVQVVDQVFIFYFYINSFLFLLFCSLLFLSRGMDWKVTF